MTKALFLVIAAGVAIGLALPSGKRPVEAAAVAGEGMTRETLLEREGNGHFYVHAKVNGELVRFLPTNGTSVTSSSTPGQAASR